MSNLNIIGNGFDLYHGLPTAYYYFACYILSNDESFYDDLTDMYGFSKGVMHYISEDLDRGIDDVGYWREFEKHLGEIDSMWIENTLMDDLELEYPDAVDLDIDRTRYAYRIQSFLKEWINNSIDIGNNYRIIDKELGEKRLVFSAEDRFISFNYTHTLEKIYGVEDILHIHGEGSLYGIDEPLIIGHGNSTIIRELKDKIKEFDGDDYDQPSRNRENEYRSEVQVLELLEKPVHACIGSLMDFLKHMQEPEKIIVWGFSLSDVDEPYMVLIRNKWVNCKWSFSYYCQDDRIRNREMAKKLKLKKNQWEEIELRNEESYKITQEILRDNKITTYLTIQELLKQGRK